jgi:hypothetical protein
MAPVSGEWVTQLYDLAMCGDVKELLAQAQVAAVDDPEGQPVYNEIQRLAQKFDMKAIRTLLQDARQAQA